MFYPIKQTQSDKLNQIIVGEAYAIELGLGYTYFNCDYRNSRLDGEILKDGIFNHSVEVRVRGRTYDSFVKQGWCPIGEEKLLDIELGDAAFVNLFKCGLVCFMEDFRYANADFYIDTRPNRVREKVYKVPIDYYVPAFRMSLYGIVFRGKGNDRTK